MTFLWVGLALLAFAATPYVAVGLLYVVVRPTGSPISKDTVEPTVSLVLPTYNEARIVEEKLEDIDALEYPTEKLELVVVDASDDGTSELIESYYGDDTGPDLRLLREDSRQGLAVALNDGYRAATNEVVVKTDCDSRLAPDALREAVGNFADPEVGGVTGRNAEVLGGSEVESNYRGMQGLVQRLESHLDSTFIFHGPFSAFRREAIVPVDTDSLADDSELALRVRRNGARVVFDPAVRYEEAAHSAFRKRRGQKDRRAMGLLRLLVRQAGALGRHGRYGRFVLPLNWLLMWVSPWLLAVGGLSLLVGSVGTFGPGALVLLLTLVGFVGLGSADLLGPFEPLYALFDTQVSLLSAAVSLALTDTDGTWEPDAELRDAYNTDD